MSAHGCWGKPEQDALISPDALPARSILLSGSRAVEMAAVICPICTRENCRLAVPRCCGEDFPAIADARQFVICASPCALPPKARTVRRGRSVFSGGREKGEATSNPEGRQGKDKE